VTAIVLVPVILIGAHQLSTRKLKAEPRRILEAFLLAAAIFVVGSLVFDRSPAGPDTSPALLYAPVPLLIWAALRFGLGGVSASMLAVTMLAMRGNGPFLAQTPSENALALQLFLLITATPLLLLAVAIDDERRSKEALSVNEERMSLAVKSAQMALWDWDVANDRVWMTEEGRKFFSFEPDEPLHYESLAGRVHPDDSAVRATAIQQVESGGSYEAEYRIILPDGAVRWVAARGHRPSPGGNDAPPDLVSAVPHHQGWRLGARPVDLPHLGDLARRAAVGGAQARARRRILCRAASGQGGRLIVAARVVRQAVGPVRTHRAHLANTLCLPLRSSWRSAPPRMDDGDRGRPFLARR